MTGAERERLVGILGRLGSEHDGERAAAGLLATRLLRQLGTTWNEILESEPPAISPGWAADLAHCRRHRDALNEWQRDFVEVVTSYAPPTPRQQTTLANMAASLRARGLA